jgi:hypothetical protein
LKIRGWAFVFPYLDDGSEEPGVAYTMDYLHSMQPATSLLLPFEIVTYITGNMIAYVKVPWVSNDVMGGKDFHLERVRDVAKKVIGVDINAPEIEKLLN